jgi:hypothetical protein
MFIAQSHINTKQIIRQQAAAPKKAEAQPQKQASESDSVGFRQFTEAEREELQEWKVRLQPDLGTLHTPPAGPVKAELEQAQGYVLDMLDKLAGPELTARNLELQVEVFSGDIPQAALDDNMRREEVWNENHPDTRWPIRGWTGSPDGSTKPIYRLAINLGMLRTLESQDELAFVLSQQAEILLDHDKRDPNNEELLSPANQNFIDPRIMSADADKAAIARMNKAGFNPRGALKALTTLYTQNPIDYPDKDLNRGLIAAAHGQEHQGMRVGLVQAEVEDYVRRGEATTAQPLKPLPSDLSIDGPAGYQKAVEDPAAFQRDYKNLALKVAGDTTPAWMFGDALPPKEVGTITYADGTKEDKELALLAAADHLSKSTEHTSQQKVDGFLRLLIALDYQALPDEGTFSPEAAETLHSFLAQNSEGWNSDKFMKSLVKGQESLHRTLIDSVVFNESFQQMAEGNLPGLAEAVPQARTYNLETNKVELEGLIDLIDTNHTDGRNSWGLAQRIDAATIDFISRQDGKNLAKETGDYGASKAMVFSNDLLGLDSPSQEFQLKLRDASSSILEAANAQREDQARLRLRLPISDQKNLYGYLNELGQSETWKAFSPGFQQDLPLLLKDVATITTTQPDMFYFEERPATHPESLESRFVGLLDGASADEHKAVLNHLTRHIQHDRKVKGRSPRREWLGKAADSLAKLDASQLVSQIASPDLSQHSNIISKTLVEGYNLKPADLPNTSTESLKALNERVKNEEFTPKRGDYASEDAYERAVDAHYEAQDTMYQTLSLVAPMESRLVLGRMALLGHNPEASLEAAKKLDAEGFKQILKGAEGAVERAEVLSELPEYGDTEHVGADAGAFLMDGFVAVQGQIESLKEWHDLATRSIDFSNGGLEARVGTKRKLAADLFGRLETLEQKELKEWLGKEKVLDILSPAQSSDLLVQCLGAECAPGANLSQLTKSIAKLDETYELTEKHPVAYVGMRDKVAEKAQLQPSNVSEVFPKKERGVTDTNAAYKEQAQALSGLLAMAREKSPEEQIDTIEYLMGRQKVMPAYLEEASDSQAIAPLTEALQTTRQDLLDSDSQTRVMVANSFLAGPSGILRSEEGKEAVINHFLKNLLPTNRELAEKIARGVLYSHGEADTLAVAFILGQKPEEPKQGQDPGKSGQLDEATILNRLFDAYGVPGIKMKQYLAFTSEFSDFKDAFEDAQDAAMPLNYYQVLKLVQKRFGDDWPKDLKIDRVLGSGSVNVAIRYLNEETGKREVVSLGREDIEESTAYDFQRFHKFIEHLTSTPEDRETFGYVLGLLNLIEDSVALEFDKEQAMNVQKMAYKTYKHRENGWTVKSIDAHRVSNLGLFMEEAKGRTARKVYTENTELYDDAMKAMSAAEFGVLKGQDSRNNWWPKEMFANPDFHDGQVMIDETDKTVTILDFGQAVPITNEDRKAGLDILTIIGKGDSPKAAAKRLNKRYFDKKKVMTPELLGPIMERKDRMDCFIHLLSALSRNGADVPLSSVHWVLGINRQMALSEKIGQPIDKQIRNMVINHKIGLPLGVYNTAHATKETAVWMGKVAADTAVKVATTIAHTIGGWFGWEPGDDQAQQAQAAPKTKPEVTYPSWRPDFGGAMPGRTSSHPTVSTVEASSFH